MSRQFKIEQYGLQKRVVELSIRHGLSCGKVARELTRETGIPISKCAVFRWIRHISQMMRQAMNNGL